MYGERLTNLDELILRCRTQQARQYIGEAVACYRAGAFRACIVVTWVAVIFDFVDKMRELALTGDKKATQISNDYIKIQQEAKFGESQQFEQSVLDWAKEFELLTPLEHEDLARLKKDRNRCAHPSMTSGEQFYQPSAELARYHLTNAVTHLLQHPPMQGKTAIERLGRDVTSEYFPTTAEEAVQRLAMGPLARPRAVLVHNFLTHSQG